MAALGLQRSTLVDASVNAFPFAILVFFMALFLVYDPWPPDLGSVVIGQGLLLIPVVVLVVATAVTARLLGDEEPR